MRALVYFSYP